MGAYSIEHDGPRLISLAEHYVSLGQSYLDRFSPLDFSGGRSPLDHDGGVEFERASEESLIGESGSLRCALVSNLCELRKRDEDLFSLGYGVNRPVVLGELQTSDENGNISSRIAAYVLDGEDGSFCIPIEPPVDDAFVGHAQLLGLADRVRFLTEVVRVFSNFVRTTGLPESLIGNVVGLLGLSVRLLGDSVSSLRKACRSDSHNEG